MKVDERETKRIVRQRSVMCEVCGVAPGQSVHHRLPRGQGGPWSPSNCLHVCGHGTLGCHGWIEHNRAESYRQGWLVRSGMDPARQPVNLRVHGGAVLLDDDGNITPTEEGLSAWSA